MQSCFRRLAERHYDDGDLDRVMAIAHGILDHPIELVEGVEETLGYLAERHHLTLFSKGRREEQHAKFERSRLKPLFDDYRIVKEKNAESYAAVVAELGMATEMTWMVGNSPKSDIYPALEVGLGAVFVPHENTWALEHAELPAPSQRFRIVERFGDLRRLF
jgi:putative hydrolase of the HAD superfamily